MVESGRETGGNDCVFGLSTVSHAVINLVMGAHSCGPHAAPVSMVITPFLIPNPAETMVKLN